MMKALSLLLFLSTSGSLRTARSTSVHDELDDSCWQYAVTDLIQKGSTIEAKLDLVGDKCGQFGPDVEHLKLLVEYQGDHRLHILIEDRDEDRYRVPPEIFTAPESTPPYHESLLEFRILDHRNFSFQVLRRDNREILFDTSDTSLIFARQFLRLRTSLPKDPNLYGLGEHSDPFRLRTKDYTRTLWNRDAGAVPEGENLYGSHPIYFEHRTTGTHGVLLMNSNGLDVKIDQDERSDDRQYLEYRAIGGVIDLYFFAGPEPADVARQYAQLISKPAMVPYWSLGFHQCKFGYRDWFEVAEVVYNYSEADIPLEVMWTDIDYMDHRRVFTLDEGNFPLDRMQEVVKFIHNRQQHYIMMVDPAVGKSDYHAYNSGSDMDVFMKRQNGSEFLGLVWPGVTVYPDWFHPNATAYWVEMFEKMFDSETGVDIDGVWIDMNEPASFCDFPCENPWKQADDRDLPPDPLPARDPSRSIPGFPPTSDGQSGGRSDGNAKQGPKTDGLAEHPSQSFKRTKTNHDGDDLLFPPYHINNHVGELGQQTMHSNLQHANGLWSYDTHNIYGALMSIATRTAMLARRPGLRPFIVTRSTFAGSGKAVAKWLGDNVSTWHHYRLSIRGMLGFASIYQQPMVGSDVCGFLGDADENLCARWTTLGAFMPFFRNHADATSRSQEFYYWPVVAKAAKWAISWRYRLLDYLYTALQQQSEDGTPAINPLWFIHPQDEATYAIDEQYYFGDCILVSPVTEDEGMTVEMYLPDDIFYDLETHAPVRGHGTWVKKHSIPFERIPLHIRGGCVIPLRSESANTTTELRKKGFELIVAPGLDGKAHGSLHIDDGESLDGGDVSTRIEWQFANGELETFVEQPFASLEELGVKIDQVTVLDPGKVHSGDGGSPYGNDEL